MSSPVERPTPNEKQDSTHRESPRGGRPGTTVPGSAEDDRRGSVAVGVVAAAAGVRPLATVLILFVSLELAKDLEFLVLRTDEAVLGENVINKVFGVLVLVLAVRFLRLRWADIGVRRAGALRHLGLGLAMGVSAFLVAYGVEVAIAAARGGTRGSSGTSRRSRSPMTPR